MSNKDFLIQSLEMCYKYSNVEDSQTLVPQKLVLDIIDFLKNQKPKILTYAELENIDFVWIEYHDEIETYPSLVIDIYEDDTAGFVDHCSYDTVGEFYLSKKNYNKLWRCWSEKPTDDQRETAPWKE